MCVSWVCKKEKKWRGNLRERESAQPPCGFRVLNARELVPEIILAMCCYAWKDVLGDCVSCTKMNHLSSKGSLGGGVGGGSDVGACVEMICFIELCAWYTGIHWRWKRCICVWVSVCVCFLNHTRNTPLCAQAHNYVLQLCVEIQCIYLLKLHVHMNSWCTTNTIKHEF